VPLPTLVVIAVAGISGCSDASRPNIDPPPLTADLYAYSVAVAERTRAMVPTDRADAIFGLARAHERFGHEKTALPLFRKGLELDPANAAAYKAMGRFYSLTGRSEQAIQAYQRALRHDPDPAGLWTQIALVLIHLGEIEEALETLETEVRRNTASPLTYYNIGLAHKSLENWDAAAAAYRKALDLEKNMREALHGLAEALRLSGKAAEAKPILARWLELKKAHDRHEREQKAAKSDAASQRRLTAETWYDTAGVFIREHNRLATSGDEDDGRRAVEYRRQCVAAIEKALEFDPTHGGALTLQLDIIAKTGSADELHAARINAAAARPDDVDLTIRVAGDHLERALVFSRSDQKAAFHEVVEARGLLERAVEKAPRHGVACGMLAEIYVKHFTRDDRPLATTAIRLARQALATLKPSASLYDVLAGAHVHSGTLQGRQDAFRVLSEGIERVPPDQRAHLRQRVKQLEKRFPGERP